MPTAYAEVWIGSEDCVGKITARRVFRCLPTRTGPRCSPSACSEMSKTKVGGYATTYKATHNFTFATLRGGRHEVPETAPGKALELMRKLVTNTPF